MTARIDFFPELRPVSTLTEQESFISSLLQKKNSLHGLIQMGIDRCKEFNHVHWSIFFTRAKELLGKKRPSLSDKNAIIDITRTLIDQNTALPPGNLAQVVSGLGAFFIDDYTIWNWAFFQCENALEQFTDTKELYLLLSGLKKINPSAYASCFQRYLPKLRDFLENTFTYKNLQDFQPNLIDALIGLFNAYSFFPTLYDSLINVAIENLSSYEDFELVNLLKTCTTNNPRRDFYLYIENALCAKECSSSIYAKAIRHFCATQYVPETLLSKIKGTIKSLDSWDKATIFGALAMMKHNDPDIRNWVGEIASDFSYQKLWNEESLYFGLAVRFYLSDQPLLVTKVIKNILNHIDLSTLYRKRDTYNYSLLIEYLKDQNPQ
ncbi:MAG: hypothetical protein K1000chlam2_00156 [Chlamydiae bacterium]|nr:hypothetical protein [Chlamydiota bacterium]